MTKPGIKILLSAALILVSVSMARADVYTVVSDWSTGYTANMLYTGNGTFTWSGGAITAISLSFINTTTHTTLWTASSTDGELTTYGGYEHLVIGDSGTDCGVACISIALPSALVTGGPQVLNGVGTGSASTTQDPNTTFIDARITDISYPDPASVPEPSSVILLLTMLAALGYAIGRKRQVGGGRAI